MGSSSSKSEKTEALGLCKLRRKLIKEAIESRYALAAAHVSYTESLRNIGVSLRHFAEAQVLIETCADKSPSHTSYPSPSPSHVVDSPLQNESPVPRLSYMKSGGATAVTVRYDPVSDVSVVDEESMAFPMPPPPPPPLIPGSGSWDYFDPIDEAESFRFMGHGEMEVSFDDMEKWGKIGSDRNAYEPELGHTRSSKISSNECSAIENGVNESVADQSIDCSAWDSVQKGSLEDCGSQGGNKTVAENDLGHEREDPSEFITHRAKDFVSSIKDIEHRFFRASEAGKEVSKMLEASKIRVGFAQAKGDSSDSAALSVFKLVCCRGTNNHVSHDPPQHVTKIITWKRSVSLQSSSSRHPLTGAPKDDGDDSGSDFVEDFCMISGSHSSTLDRLYAWERKLYDEVKASESIRKVYDRTCDQLRHQFAKDHSTHVVDKTRAVAKDLHSRMRVSLYSVDSIAKRIEKMRDDELQPQLVELVQGFVRMWKAMLESHHAQYITISLAYHARSLTQNSGGETRKQIMVHLLYEFECFGLSFANWMSSHMKYAEALNGWLQCCIMQPRERSKNRRPFSPRRALAPPIFMLCRDWATGVKELPSDEVNDAIKNFLVDLHHLMKQQSEDQQKGTEVQDLVGDNGESDCKEEEDPSDNSKSSNLHCIHTSLTKVLDRLNKFSEASLKLYEEVRQRSEAAHVAYSNCRPIRSQQKL